MNMESTSLIYNSMNYDAVIAAAILKQRFRDIEVVDVTKQVPHDSEIYVWIGIEPNAHNVYFYNLDKTKQHIVFLNRPDNVVASRRTGVDFKVMGPTYESYESMFEDEDHPIPELPPTLIDKVCSFFGIDMAEYQKLTMAVGMFHRKSTEIDLLAFTYANLTDAYAALATDRPFKVRYTTPDDEKEYLEQARIVKMNLLNNYKIIPIVDGDRVAMAVYTTINDFQIHLALRLIKLTHRNFMNMSLGLNGQIAYTNLVKPGFDHTQDKPLLLNS